PYIYSFIYLVIIFIGTFASLLLIEKYLPDSDNITFFNKVLMRIIGLTFTVFLLTFISKFIHSLLNSVLKTPIMVKDSQQKNKFSEDSKLFYIFVKFFFYPEVLFFFF